MDAEVRRWERLRDAVGASALEGLDAARRRAGDGPYPLTISLGEAEAMATARQALNPRWLVFGVDGLARGAVDFAADFRRALAALRLFRDEPGEPGPVPLDAFLDVVEP